MGRRNKRAEDYQRLTPESVGRPPLSSVHGCEPVPTRTGYICRICGRSLNR